MRPRKPVDTVYGMRVERSRLALLPAVISLAVLLYSPLCSLSCAAFDCSSVPATMETPERAESGHCHSGKGPQRPPAESHPDSNAPEPQPDSGNCPAHTDTIAVLSSAVRVPAILLQSVQPVTIIPPEAISFSLLAARTADGRPFRSPPERALTSVYRI